MSLTWKTYIFLRKYLHFHVIDMKNLHFPEDILTFSCHWHQKPKFSCGNIDIFGCCVSLRIRICIWTSCKTFRFMLFLKNSYMKSMHLQLLDSDSKTLRLVGLCIKDSYTESKHLELLGSNSESLRLVRSLKDSYTKSMHSELPGSDCKTLGLLRFHAVYYMKSIHLELTGSDSKTLGVFRFLEDSCMKSMHLEIPC